MLVRPIFVVPDPDIDPLARPDRPDEVAFRAREDQTRAAGRAESRLSAARQYAHRASSMYVKYTALLTWPNRSQSRKRA